MSWLWQPLLPGAAQLQVSGPTLVSIAVTPANVQLRPDDTQQYTAIGTYDDASQADITGSVTWSTGGAMAASISAGGLLTANAYGSAVVSATLGAIVGTTGVFVPYLGTGGWQWVVAIEGYPYLLTDGDPVAALAAWAGDDWTECLPGLFVELEVEQAIDPDEPIAGGGTCRIHVQPDPTDRFGIDTHRTQSGFETVLKASADRGDTVITVASTAAFPSSGEINIGTECIEYTGKTATTFTGCVRGKYAPFKAQSESEQRFAEHHRVEPQEYGTSTTFVTEHPRNWKGRWVGICKHRRTSLNTLETRANAELVFAGKIDGRVRTGRATSFALRSVHDVIRDFTCHQNPYRAQLKDGIYLQTGWKFFAGDLSGTTPQEADELEVVPSGATGTNEIDAGFISTNDLLTALGQWLAAETMNGTYDFGIVDAHVVLVVGIGGSSGSPAGWAIAMPRLVAIWLGFTNSTPQTIDGQQSRVIGEASTAPYQETFTGEQKALRAKLLQETTPSDPSDRIIEVEDERNSFADQYLRLPVEARAWADTHGGAGDPWGIVICEGFSFVGQYTDTEISHFKCIDPNQPAPDPQPWTRIERFMDDDRPIEMIQRLVLQGPFAELFLDFIYSTGTNDYNHATNDVLGYGVGVGIPHELAADDFDDEIRSLPWSDAIITVEIEKPTRIEELFTPDLILRLTHLIFMRRLKVVTWRTPTDASIEFTLDEDNKAEAVTGGGADQDHSSEPELTDRWAHPIVRIRYNRIPNTNEWDDDGGITIVSHSAVDDTGGSQEPWEIRARNSRVGSGAAIQDLAHSYAVWHGFFADPIWVMRRSLAQSLWSDIYPGAIIAVVGDKSIRDPVTGKFNQASGVSRVALVTAVKWSPGGLMPGASTPSPMGGSIEVAFLRFDRYALYAPAADVDETADTGGFTNGFNGTDTIKVHQHHYTEPGEAVDASHFPAGGFVRLIERDPDDAVSPDTELLEIDSVTGDEITFTSNVTLAIGSKLWRLVYDDYSASTTAQRSRVFQADDADFLIEDLAPPFLYGVQNQLAWTAEEHTQLPSRYSELYIGDGKGWDVGSEYDAIRMVENLIDHKCVNHSPMLDATVRQANTVFDGGGGSWALMYLTPIFLGKAQLFWAAINRYLYVAPWFRSADSSSVSLRVTLSKFRTKSASKVDVMIPDPKVSVTFTTAATAWATPPEQGLDMKVINLDSFSQGTVWLHIEGTPECETRGLAQCIERERE